ncbi:N-acetylneuraminate synthase family protein [Roseospira navarrensis]|uniref:Polyhydroxyalkanoate biosynthesis repressor PhaR n=1 Tax=Roseospira navarrensis TaxID=140058 RepID=A0A7X1ZH91_9PROT|nr:N-acetylneuraminate synthase family protein [Roseospira navarrensis]MQX37427.1 polyhydroxyalkanoate biosynthesis repressor PhaR [Roseospira navarrensis]
MADFEINGRRVGPDHPPYVIAEACINHEGDIRIAREMVFHARAAGADAIKFQLHVLDDEMLRDAPQSANFDDPLYDTLDRTNLSIAEHLELKALCEHIGIDYLCTPFSAASADLLATQIGVPAYKVGSGECTNHPLQRHIAGKGKPMIVSTGMTELGEVDETVAVLRATGTPFALTHCVSAYPCPYDRVNLGVIPIYAERYGVPIGLSDHSIGIYTSLGAVALGACIIEKHFSLDRTLPGPDHKSSIEPDELRELARGARAVWEARGAERTIFPEEKEIVAWARESVVSVKPIAKGATITADMVSVKRPSPGPGVIPAKDLEAVIGQTAAADIGPDRQVLWADIGR